MARGGRPTLSDRVHELHPMYSKKRARQIRGVVCQLGFRAMSCAVDIHRSASCCVSMRWMWGPTVATGKSAVGRVHTKPLERLAIWPRWPILLCYWQTETYVEVASGVRLELRAAKQTQQPVSKRIMVEESTIEATWPLLAARPALNGGLAGVGRYQKNTVGPSMRMHRAPHRCRVLAPFLMVLRTIIGVNASE